MANKKEDVIDIHTAEEVKDKKKKKKEVSESAFEVSTAKVMVVNRKKRLADYETTGGAVWLITFTDAMALMLTFFVLLFSMQQPKEEYWHDFTTALYQGFNAFKGPQFHEGRVQDVSLEALDLNSALALPYLRAILERTLSKNEGLKTVTLVENSEGLLLSLPEDLFFQSGQAKLLADGEVIVKSVASVFNRIKNQIIIRGHTDPRPITKQTTYKSNWGLSLDRALQVAQILRTYGYQRQILVQGVASTHEDLLPAELSEDQKEAISRRVDILILDNDGTVIDEIF